MSVCQSPVRARLLSDTILINCRRLPAPAVPLPCPRPAKCGAGTRMVPVAVSTRSPPAALFQPAFLSPFPFFSGCSKSLSFSLAHEPRGWGQRFVTLPSAFWPPLTPASVLRWLWGPSRLPSFGSQQRQCCTTAVPTVPVPGVPMARAEHRAGSCLGAAATDRTGLPLPGSLRQKGKDSRVK